MNKFFEAKLPEIYVTFSRSLTLRSSDVREISRNFLPSRFGEIPYKAYSMPSKRNVCVVYFQMEKDCPLNDANSHIANIGRQVEDMENKMRNTLNEIYFGKTRDIVNDLR